MTKKERQRQAALAASRQRKAQRRRRAMVTLDTWLVPAVLLVVAIAGRTALETETQKNLLTVLTILPIPFYLAFAMWVRFRR